MPSPAQPFLPSDVPGMVKGKGIFSDTSSVGPIKSFLQALKDVGAWTPQEFDDGWTLRAKAAIAEWTEGDALLVCQGTLEVWYRQQRLSVWRPGQVLLLQGFEAADGHSIQAAAAVGPVRVLRFGSPNLKAALQVNPTLGARLLEDVTLHLHATKDQARLREPLDQYFPRLRPLALLLPLQTNARLRLFARVLDLQDDQDKDSWKRIQRSLPPGVYTLDESAFSDTDRADLRTLCLFVSATFTEGRAPYLDNPATIGWNEVAVFVPVICEFPGENEWLVHRIGFWPVHLMPGNAMVTYIGRELVGFPKFMATSTVDEEEAGLRVETRLGNRTLARFRAKPASPAVFTLEVLKAIAFVVEMICDGDRPMELAPDERKDNHEDLRPGAARTLVTSAWERAGKIVENIHLDPASNDEEKMFGVIKDFLLSLLPQVRTGILFAHRRHFRASTAFVRDGAGWSPTQPVPWKQEDWQVDEIVASRFAVEWPDSPLDFALLQTTGRGRRFRPFAFVPGIHAPWDDPPSATNGSQAGEETLGMTITLPYEMIPCEVLHDYLLPVGNESLPGSAWSFEETDG